MKKNIDKTVLASALKKFEAELRAFEDGVEGLEISFTEEEAYALGAYFEKPEDSSQVEGDHGL